MQQDLFVDGCKSANTQTRSLRTEKTGRLTVPNRSHDRTIKLSPSKHAPVGRSKLRNGNEIDLLDSICVSLCICVCVGVCVLACAVVFSIERTIPVRMACHYGCQRMNVVTSECGTIYYLCDHQIGWW